MDFGIFTMFSTREGLSQAQVFQEWLGLVQVAEESGVDTLWLGESHFRPQRAVLASPLVGASAVAARTKRIRVGTAVTLLPLHHPLECAEQAATADVLSGGRLEFGVGRGSIPSQFHGFRVPLAENRARFDEALEIIRLAWTKERFSYRGAFYQVEEIAVVPRPCSARTRRSAWPSTRPRASRTSAISGELG